ncbi:MAG: hypothetical protein R3F35_20250 [Myxococcota bacterium]
MAGPREQVLDEMLEVPVRTFEDALRFAGATGHVAARERWARRLGTAGVHVVDAGLRQLHVALVREYLILKRSGLI